MTQRSSVSDVAAQPSARGEAPPPDVVSFIRYCHHRRGVGWPDLYDDMCGVAARREFHGWDHADLASRGLTFSLFEMPRLSAWVRAVLESAPEPSTPHEASDRSGRNTRRAVA